MTREEALSDITKRVSDRAAVVFADRSALNDVALKRCAVCHRDGITPSLDDAIEMAAFMMTAAAALAAEVDSRAGLGR